MTPAVAIVQPIEDVLSLKDRTYDALKAGDCHGDGHIYAGAGRTPAGRARNLSEELGRQPHAGPRGHGTAGPGRAGAGCAAAWRVCGPQDRRREILADDHGLGGAGKHGGTADYPERRGRRNFASLRTLFATLETANRRRRISTSIQERNIRFHQAMPAAEPKRRAEHANGEYPVHSYAGDPGPSTIGENDRASRSIIDHMNIIEALERRDTELAERLARQHTLDLAAHVEQTRSIIWIRNEDFVARHRA